MPFTLLHLKLELLSMKLARIGSATKDKATFENLEFLLVPVVSESEDEAEEKAEEETEEEMSGDLLLNFNIEGFGYAKSLDFLRKKFKGIALQEMTTENETHICVKVQADSLFARYGLQYTEKLDALLSGFEEGTVHVRHADQYRETMQAALFHYLNNAENDGDLLAKLRNCFEIPDAYIDQCLKAWMQARDVHTLKKLIAQVRELFEADSSYDAVYEFLLMVCIDKLADDDFAAAEFYIAQYMSVFNHQNEETLRTLLEECFAEDADSATYQQVLRRYVSSLCERGPTPEDADVIAKHIKKYPIDQAGADIFNKLAISFFKKVNGEVLIAADLPYMRAATVIFLALDDCGFGSDYNMGSCFLALVKAARVLGMDDEEYHGHLSTAFRCFRLTADTNPKARNKYAECIALLASKDYVALAEGTPKHVDEISATEVKTYVRVLDNLVQADEAYAPAHALVMRKYIAVLVDEGKLLQASSPLTEYLTLNNKVSQEEATYFNSQVAIACLKKARTEEGVDKLKYYAAALRVFLALQEAGFVSDYNIAVCYFELATCYAEHSEERDENQIKADEHLSKLSQSSVGEIVALQKLSKTAQLKVQQMKEACAPAVLRNSHKQVTASATAQTKPELNEIRKQQAEQNTASFFGAGGAGAGAGAGLSEDNERCRQAGAELGKQMSQDPAAVMRFMEEAMQDPKTKQAMEEAMRNIFGGAGAGPGSRR